MNYGDKNFGETISVATRVGVRELGVALKFFADRGIRPRSRSDLVALCVRFLANQVEEKEWPSVSETLYILDTYFPVKTRKGTKILSAQKSDSYRATVEANELAWREEFAKTLDRQKREREELVASAAKRIMLRCTLLGQDCVVVRNEEDREFVEPILRKLVTDGEGVRVVTKEEITKLAQAQAQVEKDLVKGTLLGNFIEARDREHQSEASQDSGNNIEVLSVVKQPEPGKENFIVAKEMFGSMVVSSEIAELATERSSG